MSAEHANDGTTDRSGQFQDDRLRTDETVAIAGGAAISGGPPMKNERSQDQDETAARGLDSSTEVATLRAVIYLRVSTERQARSGGEAEGYSIPAQRDAAIRKAEALGAQVVEEFVDAGASGLQTSRL